MRNQAAGLVLFLTAASGPAHAQMPLGPDFQVNTYTTFVQGEPDVAVLPDGGFVVVWDSWNQVGVGRDVFAQRYDASGARVGGEFRVNSYTTSLQYAAAVAAGEQGNFVVVWHSSHDGDNFGVFGQAFDASGAPTGAEFRVNAYTTGTQAAPDVAAGTDGEFVVVWRGAGTGDPAGVFARRFSSAGTVLGGEFRVNQWTTNAQSYPSVAADGSGNFVVVWDRLNSGAPSTVIARRYDAGGAALASEFQVNTLATNDSAEYRPAVSRGADGAFVVVWRTAFYQNSTFHRDVSGQRFDASGAFLGPELRLNAFTTNDQGRVAVATGADGSFVATWTSPFQDGSGYGVIGRHFPLLPSAPGAEFVVPAYTTSTQNYSAVAVHPNGEFVVVWTSSGRDGSDSGVFGRRFAIDHIFSDGFESLDLSAWSLSATDTGVDLAATPGAALGGTAVGLQAIVNDTAALWVQDDSPRDETAYRVRFHLDPNGFDPGESRSRFRTRVFLAFREAPMRRVAAIVLRRIGGSYSLMGRARLDDDGQSDTGFFGISDGPHLVELELRAASSPDAHDGSFTLWIDGVEAAARTGLDNHLAAVDLARLGAMSVKPGAAGTLYLDEFVSRRWSYIGP
jgi:hypothetical protein